jgi:hypothetical protein
LSNSAISGEQLASFNSNGHVPFFVEIDDNKMMKCLNSLDYIDQAGSAKYGHNLIEVSKNPTFFISHPLFLPSVLRKLYYQMYNKIMPIAIERGFSVNHNDIRLIINRCKRGYFKNWHHDNDSKTSLVVLAFYVDGGVPKFGDGGKFEIRKCADKSELLGSYLPYSNSCVAIDTQTSEFEHRGERWLSEEKTRYFIRLVFRENEK